MKILVTGCGGFLGREITRQLLRRGEEVVGFSRADYPDLREQGVRLHQGDISDATRVREVFKQSRPDAVVHTAAKAGIWGKYEDYFNPNTLGTRNILAACKQSEVASLVYTSSPSVTFGGDHQSGVDEQEPYPDRYLCAYSETKAIGEKEVLQADDPSGIRTVSLRPHLIWGHNDPHLIPRIVDRAASGRLRVVGNGENRVDTVHVINAAAAHLDAMDALQTKPDKAAGRAYFIAQDEPVRLWDWVATLCVTHGIQPPSRRISFGSAYRLGAVFETAWQIMGRTSEPPMTRFVASQLAKDHYFNITAAKERLGYRIRISMEEGLETLPCRHVRNAPQRASGQR